MKSTHVANLSRFRNDLQDRIARKFELSVGKAGGRHLRFLRGWQSRNGKGLGFSGTDGQ
jgi:hypothetical protein